MVASEVPLQETFCEAPIPAPRLSKLVKSNDGDDSLVDRQPSINGCLVETRELSNDGQSDQCDENKESVPEPSSIDDDPQRNLIREASKPSGGSVGSLTDSTWTSLDKQPDDQLSDFHEKRQLFMKLSMKRDGSGISSCILLATDQCPLVNACLSLVCLFHLMFFC